MTMAFKGEGRKTKEADEDSDKRHMCEREQKTQRQRMWKHRLVLCPKSLTALTKTTDFI